MLSDLKLSLKCSIFFYNHAIGEKYLLTLLMTNSVRESRWAFLVGSVTFFFNL